MSDILICLMGSNPLPIYVLCEYLNSKNRDEGEKEEVPVPSKYIFLCSEYTKKFAEIVMKKCGIGDRDSFLIIDDARDARDISRKLHYKLEVLGKNIKSIHINYTGGTKPMAVYSFQSIKEFCNDNNIRFIVTDIDPNRSKIRKDDGIWYPKLDKKLYDYVKMDCNTLFDIHDMEIKKEGRTSLEREEVSQKNILDWYIKDYEKGSKLVKRIDRAKNYKKETSNTEFSMESYFEEVKKNNKEYGWQLGIENYKTVSPYGRKKYKDLIKYLHGPWLEDYFFRYIIEMKEELGLSDIRLSIEPQYKGRECEIDVIAIKGYELYLFSCTASEKISTCKQKAFEAIFRADQLGGQHAKAISVNLMKENPKDKNDEYANSVLAKDMSSFGAEMNFDYIGREILADEDKLREKLRVIFKD